MGHSTEQTPGRWRTEVATPGENVWVGNALTWETRDEAEAYARDLLGRWLVPDLARVVPVETPKREPVDPTDERIVINYRS